MLVAANSADSVYDEAKDYWFGRDIPASELAYFTVEEHGHAKIDFVEIN